MNPQYPVRMVFNNGKISTSRPANALDILSIDNPILLDVRTIQEFARTKIAGAQHIALEDLQNQLDVAKSWNAPIITYCTYGDKSRIAAQLLKRANVQVIDGGAKMELEKLLQKKEAIEQFNAN